MQLRRTTRRSRSRVTADARPTATRSSTSGTGAATRSTTALVPALREAGLVVSGAPSREAAGGVVELPTTVVRQPVHAGAEVASDGPRRCSESSSAPPWSALAGAASNCAPPAEMSVLDLSFSSAIKSASRNSAPSPTGSPRSCVPSTSTSIRTTPGWISARTPGNLLAGCLAGLTEHAIFFSLHLDAVPPLRAQRRRGGRHHAQRGGDPRRDDEAADHVDARRGRSDRHRRTRTLGRTVHAEEEVGLLGAGAFDTERFEAEAQLHLGRGWIGDVIVGAPFGRDQCPAFHADPAQLRDGAGGGAPPSQQQHARSPICAFSSSTTTANVGTITAAPHEHGPEVVPAPARHRFTRSAARGSSSRDARRLRLHSERRRMHVETEVSKTSAGSPVQGDRSDRPARADRARALRLSTSCRPSPAVAPTRTFQHARIPCLTWRTG